jgi:Flp pilus assembly protein TadD
MECINECLCVVKSARGLDLQHRAEVARAFVALGEDQRRRALSLGPQDLGGAAELAFHLAYRLEPELRDPSTAVDLARSLVASHPGSAVAWEALGVARYGKGEWRPARQAFEKAIALQPGPPEDVETEFLLAMALWRCGDRDGAHQWYERAVQQMDIRSHRVHGEAAALLGVTGPPKPTGNDEESTARSPKR